MFVSRIALGLSILALLLLLAGGPGYRLGLWDLGFGLAGALRYAMYLGIAGALLGLIGLCWPRIRRGRPAWLVFAMVLGIAVIAVPLTVRHTASSLPPIHDISTDLENPPAFQAIAPLRADAPNPVEYAGEDTARQQAEAYPELQTVTFSAPPDEVFEAAEDTARAMGWALVAAEKGDGLIEATDTTFWYGFKDDVVIRIQAGSDGTLVDVRSKSRLGRSDLGKNAARIEAFLERLQQRMEP